MLSVNISHDKRDVKEIRLEGSVVVINFIKNCAGKKFVLSFMFAIHPDLHCKSFLLTVSAINAFTWIYNAFTSSKCFFDSVKDLR